MNPDDGLNKVKTVTLYINGCTDEELLKLKVPCLKMKNNFITDRGLSRLLKVSFPFLSFFMYWCLAMEERRATILLVPFGFRWDRRDEEF